MSYCVVLFDEQLNISKLEEKFNLRKFFEK